MYENYPKITNEDSSKEYEEMVVTNPEVEVVRLQPTSPLHDPGYNNASSAIEKLSRNPYISLRQKEVFPLFPN